MIITAITMTMTQTMSKMMMLMMMTTITSNFRCYEVAAELSAEHDKQLVKIRLREENLQKEVERLRLIVATAAAAVTTAAPSATCLANSDTLKLRVIIFFVWFCSGISCCCWMAILNVLLCKSAVLTSLLTRCVNIAILDTCMIYSILLLTKLLPSLL